ncbi:hypothetical protein [Streptomyces xantholiticus]|uniref:Uncharacterized protein n=1 Tax=Streptomyces xantholiticus TaxID=68285 RepID=A0ABV1V453_9ACTN
MPASEADDLEAGAVSREQCEMVELDGMAPRGVRRRPGRGPGGHHGPGLVAAWRPVVRAAELAVHIVDVRQRERVGLERLEAFVRETVLPRTYPHTMERRRVMEALGKADRLCNARTIEYSTGDVILRT